MIIQIGVLNHILISALDDAVYDDLMTELNKKLSTVREKYKKICQQKDVSSCQISLFCSNISTTTTVKFVANI